MAHLVARKLLLFRMSIKDFHVSIYRASFDVEGQFALGPSFDLIASVLHYHDVDWGEIVC